MKTKRNVIVALTILLVPAALLTAQPGPNVLPKYSVPADTSAPPPDFVPVEKEPGIIKQAVPEYPELAQKADVEGDVVVKVWVGKNGIPRQAIVLRFSANAKDSSSQLVKGKGGTAFVLNHGVEVPVTIFKQPAIDAAMKYRFTPAIMNGHPVAVWVVIPFTFKLNPHNENKSGSSAEVKNTGAGAATGTEAMKAARLSELISRYNLGMYHERRKENRDAVEEYQLFLRDAEGMKVNLNEMVRHAKEYVQAHSKALKKQR